MCMEQTGHMTCFNYQIASLPFYLVLMREFSSLFHILLCPVHFEHYSTLWFACSTISPFSVPFRSPLSSLKVTNVNFNSLSNMLKCSFAHTFFSPKIFYSNAIARHRRFFSYHLVNAAPY